MDRYTHVQVCGGSELEYTNGRKDFIFWPRLEKEGEENKFSVLFKEGTENFQSSLGGNRCFFNIRFQFQEPPPPGSNKLYFPYKVSVSDWRKIFFSFQQHGKQVARFWKPYHGLLNWTKVLLKIMFYHLFG